ncbi:MAG: transporter related protein, partial [Chthonomonadaceae bacterium]|nr:transporter related protein [Chthonomonadaceae bacterium]
VENPAFSVELLNSQRDELFAASTVTDDPRPGLFHAGEDVMVRVSFRNVLASDRYRATLTVEQENHRYLDRRERFLPVMITSTHRSGALAELPHHIELERTGPPAPVADDGSRSRARREARKVRS